MSRAVALSSLSCLSMELAMRQRELTLGTSLYPFITEDNLDIITREMLSGKVLGITTLTKISQELAKNLSYLIMMRWRCIGRYTSVKVHSMPLLLEIEELPQWVKLYLDIKSMNYLNPHAKDLLYCWTQTPRNTQSILRSNLLPIKSQGGVLPEGKDVNDLGRKETLRLVYQTRYQSYQDLIQIRNSLE